ncbi:MAG TPA: hypothetical protein VI451_00295, partial [Anaerolineales bacterium]|nr:hypothetical protein [Anaerolineales bacterium]
MTTFELTLTTTTDPHQFLAHTLDGSGEPIEHTFAWRTDSTALHLTLGELARAAIRGEPPAEEQHVKFGRQLYDSVFAGAVGERWNEQRKKRRRQPLRLVLRIAAIPGGQPVPAARHLLALPW